MKTVNIHRAKTHLSRFVEEAGRGEAFIITKAGKPIIKVTPIAEKPMKRIGFMEGQFEVPDDFDSMMADETAEMFYGGEIEPPKDKS